MTDNHLKELFKKTFDTVAEGYDNPAMRFFVDSVPYLADYLNLDGSEHILDVATGTGNTALALAGHVPEGRVCGIDFSKGMLAQAEEKKDQMNIRNLEFIEMDMQAIDMPDHHFDVAVCSFGIFFVEDMVAQLSHIAQKVKPGGKIATTSFYENMFSPQTDLFLNRIERYGIEIPPMTWKRMATQPKCNTLFQEAKLTDINTYQKDIGYYLPKVDQWWNILWNAGFRGLISQLSEDDRAIFKKEHLAEVEAICDENGLWLNVEVIYTIGTIDG